MRQLNDLEEQMLVCLASDTRLLNDLATTRKLADLKKHYDETLERYDWKRYNSPMKISGFTYLH